MSWLLRGQGKSRSANELAQLIDKQDLVEFVTGSLEAKTQKWFVETFQAGQLLNRFEHLETLHFRVRMKFI